MNSSETESEKCGNESESCPDLIGLVFDVPDKWWGFEAVGRSSHRGACIREVIPDREFDMLKGVGAENRTRYHKTEVLVVPTETNGLTKNTLFSVRPRPMRRHRLKNLLGEATKGRLSDDELQRLRSEMVRQFGQRGTQ